MNALAGQPIHGASYKLSTSALLQSHGLFGKLAHYHLSPLVLAVAFFFLPFSAQKSHVKPPSQL